MPIGGITNLGKSVQALGPRGIGGRLSGQCDAAEEGHIVRSLGRLGLGPASTRDDHEALGFFGRDADLEDELICALGTAGVARVTEREGEWESFRRVQDQPAQRQRGLQAQQRRFMSTRYLAAND